MAFCGLLVVFSWSPGCRGRPGRSGVLLVVVVGFMVAMVVGAYLSAKEFAKEGILLLRKVPQKNESRRPRSRCSSKTAQGTSGSPCSLSSNPSGNGKAIIFPDLRVALGMCLKPQKFARVHCNAQ